MRHEEFITTYYQIRKKDILARVFLLIAIVAGIFILYIFLPWLQKISIEWFNFQNKDDLAFILFLLLLFLPLPVTQIWDAHLKKKTSLKCPHCNKSLIDFLPAQLAIAAQRCQFCGRELFTKSSSHTNHSEPLGNISSDPAFLSRDEFQKACQAKSKNFQAKFLIHASILVPFSLGSIIFMIVLTWIARSYPVLFIPASIIGFIGVIYISIEILSVAINKLNKQAPLCPHCQTSLRDKTAASVVLTTGNCCYCGKTLWAQNRG